jgi:hypothetical protein
MHKNVINLDKYKYKYKSKSKRPPLVNSQEETQIYIEELTEEFNSLIKNEREGGEKNGCTRKSIRKRT